MNADLFAFLQYLIAGIAAIVTISMIFMAAGQKLIAAKAARSTAARRQQRVFGEHRTAVWGGNTMTFRR